MALNAEAEVVPQPVLHDGAAQRSVDVVDAVHRRRLRRAARLQVGVEIVRLHVLRKARDERQARQPVTTLPRDDVHLQTGGFRLAQTTRCGHRHFRGVADVGGVVRRLIAAGRVADVESIDSQTRFDTPAAVDREDREHRAGIDVASIGHQAWNHAQQIAVAADTRHVPHRLVVERNLAPRALNIDDRRLTGDGDSLLHAADAQFAVNGRDTSAADDQPVSLDGGEARKGEGH